MSKYWKMVFISMKMIKRNSNRKQWERIGKYLCNWNKMHTKKTKFTSRRFVPIFLSLCVSIHSDLVLIIRFEEQKNELTVAWISHSADLNGNACVYMHVIAITYWLLRWMRVFYLWKKSLSQHTLRITRTFFLL